MTTHKKKVSDIKENNDGGRIPPQDINMEKSVLGSIISGSEKYVASIMAELEPEMFYLDQHQKVCEAILQLYRNRKPIDLLSVIDKLKANESLEIVGGQYYLMQLTAAAPSSYANIEYHIKLLQQMALKRKTIISCMIATKQSYDDDTSPFEIIQSLQGALDGNVKLLIKGNAQKVSSIHEEILKEAMHINEHGGISGVPSGLDLLDNLTNGWQKSDMIVLAGRPAMGKTAFAISIILNAAVMHNIPVAFFSLEMSKQQIVARMQSQLSGIDVDSVTKKKLTNKDIADIGVKAAILETAPIYIDDTPSLLLLDLRAKARRLVSELGVKFIVIDYLQLMRSGEVSKNMNRENEISAISRGVKALAKELDIPIMPLAQLSRDVEKRGGDKIPSLSDLRDSGQIEQDADMVIFPYRPEYYKAETYEVDDKEFSAKGLLMAIIAKHRNGPIGEIPLKFVHYLAKVENHPAVNEDQYVDYTDVNENENGFNPDKALDIAALGQRIIDTQDEAPF